MQLAKFVKVHEERKKERHIRVISGSSFLHGRTSYGLRIYSDLELQLGSFALLRQELDSDKVIAMFLDVRS